MKIRESYLWTAFGAVLVCSGIGAVKYIFASQASALPSPAMIASPPTPPATQAASADPLFNYLPTGNWRPDEIQFGLAVLHDQDTLSQALADLQTHNNAMEARFEKEFSSATETKRIADNAVADHVQLSKKVDALEAENASLTLELEAFKAYCESKGMPTTMQAGHPAPPARSAP
jgi:hypothetical protein